MFETLTKLPIPVLVVSVLYSFAALGIAVAVIVAAAMRWSEVRPHFRPGLRLAALALVLSIPGILAQVLYLEVPGLTGGKGALDPDVLNGIARVAVAFTAAFWAVAHVANTDAVWIKSLQIFLIGLGFGAIARRFSVEACIVGHMGLNLAAVTLAVLWLPGA